MKRSGKPSNTNLNIRVNINDLFQWQKIASLTNRSVTQWVIQTLNAAASCDERQYIESELSRIQKHKGKNNE